MTRTPTKTWKSACSTGLLLSALVLGACGAPQGPIINISEDVAVEYGREALEHARHHAGVQDVTPADVVAGFDAVIAEQTLREWWVAEAVGDSMTQISFLVISEAYKLEHPDVSYPLLGESSEAPETPVKGTEPTTVPAAGETSPTTQPPVSEGGAEGLSGEESVVLAKNSASATTVVPKDDASGHEPASNDSTTHDTAGQDGHGAPTGASTSAEDGIAPASAGDGNSATDESTSAGVPLDAATTTPSDHTTATERSATTDSHGEAVAERRFAGGLPREAFSVVVAACVRELYEELRVRGGACPGNAGGHGTSHTATDAHAAPHWGYGTEDGPAVWGDLAEEYEKCKVGLEQSPVDLNNPIETAIADTELRYRATEAASFDSGHTLKLSFELGSSAVVEERTHRLIEVHFHAQSEHTLKGEKFPVELHFVHMSQNNALAVVGVLVTEGAENTAWAPLINALAGANAESATPVGLLNIQQMMPEAPLVYRYKGSLTEPPCSEGVVWSVMAEPIELSATQISKLTDRYSQNARDVQPLHERQLLLDDAAG